MKKGIAFTLLILALLFAAYSGAWLYAKDRIEQEIDRAFADAAKHDITFMGDKPAVTGFPGAPTIHYTEGIRIRNWQLSFSDVIIEGYPLPGMPVHIYFPAGVIAWADNKNENIAIDEMNAFLRIPKPVPRSFEGADMRAWQQAGGQMEIIDTLVRYDNARLNINGTLVLDDTLQPEGNLTMQTRGHADLLQKLTEAGKIKPVAGFALLAALNNFTLPEPDPKTGEAIAELPVTIRDRSVYVGPVLVGALPALVWDTHTPPALRQ